jgi:hypothetical protein
MRATGGRLVQTPKKKKKYKVVLEHEDRADTEESVNTMREGEALLREKTPTPPERDKSRDRTVSDV